MTIEQNFSSACKKADLTNISCLLKEHPPLKKKWGKISTLSERHKLMIKAASKGYTDVVLALMTTPSMDINKLDSERNTALILAAQHGRSHTVKALLKLPGILVNHRGQDKDTALICAAQEGHINTVKLLLAYHGIRINQVNELGESALLCAAREGHTEVVNALLQAQDIFVNRTDSEGNTPLKLAAQNGHIETVRALLNAPDIDLHQPNEDEDTAIIAAFENTHDQIVALLRQHGAYLPPHLNRLNQAQSAHEVSVHLSVSRSATNLLTHYPHLSNLKKIKSEIKKLDSWLKNHFRKKTKLPSEYHSNWLSPAKRCVARLSELNFTDERSHITLQQALALVWAGINNPSFSAEERVNRSITFLKHLYEIQRGYNFTGEGANPIDMGGTDEPTCVSGSFNKLIAALSEVGHPGVQLIFITQALIIEQVPILTKQAFGDLSEVHQKKFAQGWESKKSETLQADCFALLKHLVASKLHEKYDEFNAEVPNLNQVIEHATNNVEYTDMDDVIKKWLENNQKKEREKSKALLDFSPSKAVTFSYKSGSHKGIQPTDNNNDITPESRYPKRTRSFTGSYKGF